jgi:mono/diheme cytochrome c family protein
MSKIKWITRTHLSRLSLVLAVAFVAGGCRQDMHDQPRYETYEDGAGRVPVEGTVARGALGTMPGATPAAAGAATSTAAATPAPGATPAAGVTTQAGATPPVEATPRAGATPRAVATGTPRPLSAQTEFPMAITPGVLARGESRYNINCAPCHSKLGDGNGMIVQRGFKKPPSYHEERLRNSPVGYFVDVMTNGFGAMASYSDKLSIEDRWNVAAYIRVLQVSQNAKIGDIPAAERAKLESGQPAAPTAPQGGHNR